MRTSESATLPPPKVTWPLAFERSWPYLAGILIAFVYRLAIWDVPVSSAFKDVLSTSAGLFGTMAGFLVATAGILTTITGSRFIVQAKEAGVYSSLVRYALTAMGWCIATSVASIIGLLFDWNQKALTHPHVIVLIWLVIATISLATIVRVIRLFSAVMKRAAEH